MTQRSVDDVRAVVEWGPKSLRRMNDRPLSRVSMIPLSIRRTKMIPLSIRRKNVLATTIAGPPLRRGAAS